MAKQDDWRSEFLREFDRLEKVESETPTRFLVDCFRVSGRTREDYCERGSVKVSHCGSPGLIDNMPYMCIYVANAYESWKPVSWIDLNVAYRNVAEYAALRDAIRTRYFEELCNRGFKVELARRPYGQYDASRFDTDEANS